MEWQPIETAPKDKRVLLGSSCMEPVCGSWDAGLQMWTTDAGRAIGPTHWIPLPSTASLEE